MKRFISNYTIFPNGEEVINHITTVNDDGTLRSIEPFDRELGNTIYVPQPLCIAATGDVTMVEQAFHESPSRDYFKKKLVELDATKPLPGALVAVVKLDFANNILNQL